VVLRSCRPGYLRVADRLTHSLLRPVEANPDLPGRHLSILFFSVFEVDLCGCECPNALRIPSPRASPLRFELHR